MSSPSVMEKPNAEFEVRGAGSPSARHSALRPGHSALLSARRLEKSYRKGRLVVPVLKGVDFSVREGGFVAVVGQSGCGKSTLLHLLGTLDAPDDGEVHFEGQRIDNLGARMRDHLRNLHFGMIFQFYHLLPELSTLENVLAPIMIRYGVLNYWRHKRMHTERAKELLAMVKLDHRLTHKPRELSGGAGPGTGEPQLSALRRALPPARRLTADYPDVRAPEVQRLGRLLRSRGHRRGRDGGARLRTASESAHQ